MPDQPRWDLVDLPGGRSWEVFRPARSGGAPGRERFGTITVGEFGYTVRDVAGAGYGPFTTLDEAAYALAAREELGDPLLLGDPVVGAPVPGDRPAATSSGGIGATGSGTGAGTRGAGPASPDRSPLSERGAVVAVAAGIGALVAALLLLAVVRAVRSPRPRVR